MRFVVFALALLAAPAAAQELTRAPELVTSVEAAYPEAERAAGRQAEVVLSIVIGADGTVTEAEIVTSAGADFDAAALAAVRQFVFRPAELDGVPAAVRVEYRYAFRLAVEAPPPPSTASLLGVVRDRAEGAAIPGVLVTLVQGEVRHEITTDAEGRFALTELAPGAYTVTLVAERLTAVQTEETLAAGEQLEVAYDVSLAPIEDAGAPSDDLEIVVTAPALRRAAVSTEVRAEEARLVPGTSGDVVRVVESLPGVARAAAGSGSLVVWGAAPDDTRIYVDGVPIPRLMHEGGLRSVVQPEFVEAIELVPGGYGGSWGRGLGGLVAIRTRTPEGDGVHGTVAVDLLDAAATVRGAVGDRVRLATSARVSLLDLYAEPALGAEALAFVPIPRYRDGQARASFDLGGGDRLELVGLLASDRYARGVPNTDPALATSETRALDFQRLYLRWVRDHGDGTVVSVTPFVGRDERLGEARFGPIATSVTRETFLGGLRASWRSRLAAELSLEVGLDAEVSESRLARRGSIGLPTREGDLRVFGQPPPPAIATDTWSVTTVSIAPYVEADVAPFGELLHVVPSLRVDPYLRSVSRRLPAEGDTPAVGLFRQDFRAEPRLTVLVAPLPELSLRGAVGLVHQPAPAEDLSAAFGTPDLGVAQGLHLVLAAAARPTPTTTLELTGFYTETSGLPMRSDDASPLRARALDASGSGRNVGLSALVRQELLEGFQGWITYTLSRSERLDRLGAAWRLSDFDQTHVLTAVLAYEIPLAGLEVSVRFRYATGAPRTVVLGAVYDAALDRYQPAFGAHNGTRLPDFVQLDARLGRRFEIGPMRLDVSLEVLNVWNQTNAEEIVYGPDFSTRGLVAGFPVLPVLGIRGEL